MHAEPAEPTGECLRMRTENRENGAENKPGGSSLYAQGIAPETFVVTKTHGGAAILQELKGLRGWFLTCAVTLLSLGVVSGQTNRTWNGSVSSDWFNATNWTPVGVPSSNDTINFTSGTIDLTAPVTVGNQFNWSGGSLTGNGLTIASNAVLEVIGSGSVALYAPLTNAGTINWSNTVTWYVYNNGNSPYSGSIYN